MEFLNSFVYIVLNHLFFQVNLLPLNYFMKKLILFSFVAITIAACKKEGLGGQNTIVAYPKHHSTPIPGATIYIKYGTESFPGDDVTKYDASMVAEPEGGSGEIHVHFENLNKGSYYLYGVGYDSTISQVVKGGVPVKITSKSGETSVTVPVTED